MPDPDHKPHMFNAPGPTMLWKFAFKSADVLFKLVSWLLLTVALRTAGIITGNYWIHTLAWIVAAIYGMVLFALSAFLVHGSYDRSLFLPGWYMPIRIIGGLIGVALLGVLVSPLLLMDQLVDALTSGLRR
jgi:hypothetical protein